jgi:hypothetical protein
MRGAFQRLALQRVILQQPALRRLPLLRLATLMPALQRMALLRRVALPLAFLVRRVLHGPVFPRPALL